MFNNIGKTERLIRIIFGIFLIILGLKFVSGYFAYAFFLIGILAIITGFVGWCGLYSVCNISTKGVGINKISKKEIADTIKTNKVKKEIEVKKVENNKKDAVKKTTKNKKELKVKKVENNKKDAVKKTAKKTTKNK